MYYTAPHVGFEPDFIMIIHPSDDKTNYVQSIH